MAKQFTLGKNERLKSRKQIEELFDKGKTFITSSFRVYYLIKKKTGEQKTAPDLQFGVGVSGKNFKKAVDRNNIKRLTKEAFRLQKLPLQKKLKAGNIPVNLFFIYTGKELPDFNFVKEKVAVALKKLESIIDENVSSDS